MWTNQITNARGFFLQKKNCLNDDILYQDLEAIGTLFQDPKNVQESALRRWWDWIAAVFAKMFIGAFRPALVFWVFSWNCQLADAMEMESSDVKLPALKELQSSALSELQNKMNEVHSMLSALMSGLSAQSIVLNELRSVVKNNKNDGKDAFRLSDTTTSELQLHMDALAAPSDEPPVLAVIPAAAPVILDEMWETTKLPSAKVSSIRSATSLKSPISRPSNGAQSPGQRANSKNKSDPFVAFSWNVVWEFVYLIPNAKKQEIRTTNSKAVLFLWWKVFQRIKFIKCLAFSVTVFFMLYFLSSFCTPRCPG